MAEEQRLLRAVLAVADGDAFGLGRDHHTGLRVVLRKRGLDEVSVGRLELLALPHFSHILPVPDEELNYSKFFIPACQ